jgi:Cdc6-like AAA superfamily ATPase
MPTIVKNKFSPSVNILRDKGVAFDYTQTRNASQAASTILNNYRSGVRSFIIIGAYGTGKSSFLLALSQNLSKKTQHFSEFKKQFGALLEFDFIDIVGEYNSLEKYFSMLLGGKHNLTAELIIEALESKRRHLARKKKGLAILIDEFGKFLEYASKNNPELELYFIQQLAEWSNNVNRQQKVDKK